MTSRPTGWNRLVARLRGEVPAAALEAYRRASLPVVELLEQVERRRLECSIDGMDPWTVPPAERTAFLCAWNAFVLQTLGSDLLDADYRTEPATHGYVPPVTAQQVLAFYEPVEGWVNRAYQAQANPEYRLDVPAPAPLPAWVQAEPLPPSHLPGLLHALRTVADHADAAMTFLPATMPDAPEKQAQLNRIRQLHASARARARYAEELCGVDPVPEVHARAAVHARDAMEQLSLLGQLIADPVLAEPAPAPALPPARAAAPALPSIPRRTVHPDASVREKRANWFLNVAADPQVPLPDRKSAIMHACWGTAPVRELAALYDRLDEPALKERLVIGLAARKEAEGVEKVARIALEDADPALRRTALYWLRVSTHARAPRLLAEVAAADPTATRKG
jgi:hypothetical protein